MNVILLQPETPGTEGWCPPLGLAYLAAVLQREGHQVQLVDLNARHVSDEQLLELINLSTTDIVGITSTMASHKEAIRLARLLDGCRIAFGGPQASARPKPYLDIPNAVVFRGEAEVSFPAYLREIEHGDSGLGTPGLVFRSDDGKVVLNPPPPLIFDLNGHPLPARHLFDMEAYTVHLKGRRATNMMSSRGCPFDCIFCYHDFLGKVYRARSPESVVSEVEFLVQEYDIGAILFYDDNFTLNRRRVHAICDLMVERNVDVAWRCYSRVDAVNAELLQRMKEAGCCEIVFGVESGNQRTLDLAHKGIRVEDSIKAIRLCREIGISTKSYLMIGFPWETKQDIEDTINFIDEILPSQVHLVIVVPFPGTPLEQMLLEQGVGIDPDVDITGIAQPSYETQDFTKEDLLHYRDLAYEKIQDAKVSHVLSYEWQHDPDWRRQFKQNRP
jgi:anaerobic magnesium-protoporphyrin IX monomethyl ester cyclase